MVGVLKQPKLVGGFMCSVSTKMGWWSQLIFMHLCYSQGLVQSVYPPSKNVVLKSKLAADRNHQWTGNFEPLRVCIHRPTGKCWIESIERVPFRAIWWGNTCSSVRFVFVRYLLLAIERWIQANYGPHNDPRIVATLWNECTVMHPNMVAFRCLKNYCIFITVSLRYSISTSNIY